MNESPWKSGKFKIAAGLRPLGNNPIFQEENDLEFYLENKRLARQEGESKYYPPTQGLSSDEMELIGKVLQTQILKDLPHYSFDKSFPARDEVDFFISQVPEDFSMWKKESNKEWLALIHLSAPNHWAAADKIGKSFFEVHSPVPHIDPISKVAIKLFDQVVQKGAVERFAWGLSTDKRLNHHPHPPADIPLEQWKGRSFDPLNPELYIRLERQTLFPFSNTLLGFTIKTTFISVFSLPPEERISIKNCIMDMDDKLLHYKGLLKDKENILNWINSLF